MAKKQFKTESKKLLDMMINSIYTHKEIFLRELLSNASDAIDKLYYRSLTDGDVGLSKESFEIKLSVDKDSRTIVIEDNGIGMTKDELENNLGTIAKSGSFDFKNDNEKKEDVDIIGQFGVGFYSAFMVSDSISVLSRAYGNEQAYEWKSSGVDGYTVTEAQKDSCGTVITLHVKEDAENENYSEFLDKYRIRALVKKYSDYLRYPIKMDMDKSVPVEGKEGEYETVVETQTLNSMIPIWKKQASECTNEEYEGFYREKFFDYESPIKIIHSKFEGLTSSDVLLFIPKHAPFDYYTKDFEKGLQLYSSGVLIMDKCADLLPDYFSFVRGVADSADLSLNISRETLQHDAQLKSIAKNIEKKIKNELLKMLKDEREKYEEFFKAFGIQLKYGLYSDYGTHKDVLKDLILFISSADKKYVSLKEYVSRMKEDQKTIYYAAGETVDKIDMLPQVEAVKDKGFEILYLTDDVDEFALKMLGKYDDKEFTNVCDGGLDILSDEEKKELEEENKQYEDMFKCMKEALGDSVNVVRFTKSLKNHPVCLVSEGDVSLGMEKVLEKMPENGAAPVRAQTALEINEAHPIAKKLRELYGSDREKLSEYSKILYAQARLIGGMTVDNPTELAGLVCGLIS